MKKELSRWKGPRMASWRKTEEDGGCETWIHLAGWGGGQAFLAMGFSWSNPRDAKRRNVQEKAGAYFADTVKIICLSAISKWICPKHHVPFPLESMCCLLSSACSTGGRSIFSPIMCALYHLTIKSARCCDEISKINICSDERYIGTRSNGFHTFNIFRLRPPVTNANPSGVLSWFAL